MTSGDNRVGSGCPANTAGGNGRAAICGNISAGSGCGLGYCSSCSCCHDSQPGGKTKVIAIGGSIAVDSRQPVVIGRPAC